MSLGLAWSNHGGSPMYIECTKVQGGWGGNVMTTGRVGEVMRESISIAYTNAKRIVNQIVDEPTKNNRLPFSVPVSSSSSSSLDFLNSSSLDPSFFSSNSLHLHLPSGAIRKDGSASGLALLGSLLSLCFSRPLPSTALTGEITLLGKVLGVGAMREKIIAAKRLNIKKVIVSKENEAEIEGMRREEREGVKVVYVETVEEAVRAAFWVESVEEQKKQEMNKGLEQKERNNLILLFSTVVSPVTVPIAALSSEEQK